MLDRLQAIVESPIGDVQMRAALVEVLGAVGRLLRVVEERLIVLEQRLGISRKDT